MDRNTKLTAAAAALGMGILILDGQTALSGASRGVDLCLRTVIPSLFPFFLLSIILTGTLSGISIPLFKPISRLFGIPDGTQALLLTAFLGGYPVGAQCVSQAYQDGQLPESLARRMLLFCNNAGPSFLFGMVAMQFPSLTYAWILWGIQVLSALAVARTFPSYEGPPVPVKQTQGPRPNAMASAIRVMGTVCGWVILFRVILAFWERWFFWLLPETVQILLTGLLELANGCCQLGNISNVGLRLLIASLLLSLGGLCVTMQTSSVLGKLPLKDYLRGKGLQGLYAGLMAVVVQSMLPGALPLHPLIPAAIALVFFLEFLRKRQKNYSLSRKLAV